MTCGSCGHANPERARFCLECGAPVAQRCAGCATELPAGAKFCFECGAPVAPTAARGEPAASAGPRQHMRTAETAGARKVVTIVFADLVGSTALHERLDPESARGFMEGYYAAMRGAVDAQGGSVTQLLGDGIKAMFGVPRVAEDDALRAVRAAVAMQRAFRELAERYSALVGKTGLRIAVNTGEVVVSDDSEIIGDPVNVAARLQEQGRDGDVVIGDATARLVAALVTLAPLGSFTLKGRAEPVAAYRVESLERPEGTATAAFVGRDGELARMTRAYEAAVATPATSLVVLVGSPGLGKSRLIDEFTTRRGERATVISAHCNAAGGATFAPLADALRTLLGVDDGASGEALRPALEAALSRNTGDDAERARIVAGIGGLLAGSPASPEETFFVVRRLLAALASRRPVVLVIDDLHWAEPLLLDLVEHLVQWGAGVPLLVLVGARPELRDVRSALVAPGGVVADVVTLGGLDAGAAMRLAANVIGAADLPAAVAAKVLATSEGNPLFVGELVRMLVQEGALTREGERWTTGAGLASLEMPPTIHALLAARIERLRPDDRSVLERAAVVGRRFSRGAVAALIADDGVDLDTRLESLKRSELIEPDSGWLLGEPVLRFHHVLIRDAAYRRLLKGTRAELHARFADWIGGRAADSAEHDETVGWHLEQAHQHLRELGPIDAKGRALGERASRHLAAAGRRALARDDVPLAAGLLGRAVATLDPDDPARAELALDWCEALLAAGDVGPASGAIDELGRFSAGSERLGAWQACFAGQLKVLTTPDELRATAGAVAAATDRLTVLDDAAGQATGHYVHALALARLGQVGACEGALDRALAAARRAGDRRRANTVLAIAPLAALWGPSPVTRASGRCLDVVRVLRITQGAPAVEAVALSCQGVLEALRGRTDAARRMIASARKMVEELGITQRLLEADAFAGLVDLLDGDPSSAERSLRSAYEGLRELGLGIDAARAAALLARALLALDRVEEAEGLSHDSEALAGDDLKAAIAWRGVRAEALARRGEHAAAIELASRAVEIAAATDALLDHADARTALAVALRAARRGAEADAEERRAIELWEAKGATLLAERARDQSGRVGAPRGSVGSRAASASAGVGAPSLPVARRIRPNAAQRDAERGFAAIASRDPDAVTAAHAGELHVVHHPTGATYGTAEAIAMWRGLWRTTNLVLRQDALATLGDSLVLVRRSYRHDGAETKLGSIGPVTGEYCCLLEIDDHEPPTRRSEVFAEDRLGEAIARLYVRHAELRPAGAEGVRAAATAQSIATMMAVATHGEVDQLASALSPAVESIDHRQLGLPPARGAGELVRDVRALFDLAADIAISSTDVLGLEDHALLQRISVHGTDRSSGGVFELPVLLLWAFDDDGLLARWEVFDAEREPQALAHFAGLAGGAGEVPSTTSPLPPPARRRVTPNAGSAAMARVDAALAARDLDAMGAFAASFEEVSHPTGASYGRDAMLASVDRFHRLPGATTRHELLATLGDGLWLFRRWMSADAAGRGRFDVGAYEKEEVGVNQLDASGAHLRNEIFAADHLGDAVVNLYTRHAATLPEGPLRARATATAGAIAAMAAPPDLERYATALAPSVEFMDHRTVGFASGSGAAKLLRGFASLLELASDVTTRVDDVLCLEPGALLLRWTTAGIDRRSGGAFESPFLLLWVFGANGLIVHDETFDAQREAEALARYDALVRGVEPTRAVTRRRVRPNAASGFAARFAEAFSTGDQGAVGDLFASSLEVVDHQNGASYGRDGHLASVHRLRRAREPVLRFEPIATLGEWLLLCRRHISASGTGGGRFDVAEYDREEIVLFAVDVGGRCRQIEIFTTDHLGDSVPCLYARSAATLADGQERDRAAAIARTLATAVRPADLEAWCATIADSFELVDHRVLGVGSLRGGEAMRANYRAMFSLEDRPVVGVADVLAAEPDALLARLANSGVARGSGGTYERRFLQLCLFDRDGRIAQMEYFDDDRDAEALARFDELTALGPERSGPAATRLNAASRARAQVNDAFLSCDWDGMRALACAEMTYADRRHWAKTSGGVEMWLESSRTVQLTSEVAFRDEVIATVGERIELRRRLLTGSADGGAFESEFILLTEVDADGKLVASINFDVEAQSEASLEAHQRFVGDAVTIGGPREPGNAASRLIERGWRRWAARDWEGVMAELSPAMRMNDRRRRMHLEIGPEEFLVQLRMLFDQPASRWEGALLATRGERLSLHRVAFHAEVDTGGGPLALEDHLGVQEIDADGRWIASVSFDLDDEDAAYAELDARFAAGEGAAHPRALAVWLAMHTALAARDWAAVAAVQAPERVSHDHRLLGWGTLHGPDAFVRTQQVLFELAPDTRYRAIHLATAEHGYLHSTLIYGTSDGGPFELAYVLVSELDVRGRICRVDIYDVDRVDQARARFAEVQALGAGMQRFANAATASAAPVIQCLIAHDWEGFRRLFAEDFHMSDRRRVVQLELDREQYVAFTREVADGRTVRNRWEMVATRGDRLAVTRTFYEFTDADVGPSEIAFLLLMEVDEGGRVVGNVRWDLDDLDAAHAELDARWAAGEGASHPREVQWLADYQHCFAARDWAGMASILAPDLLSQSHRLVSWGTVHGPAGLVSTLQAQIELAPDTQVRFAHGRVCRGGLLLDYTWHGTRDGGTFQMAFTTVVELDRFGRARRIDMWEAEHLEQARARFAELHVNAARASRLAIARGNAATALADRWQLFDDTVETDWDELRASCAPEIVFEDRQGFAHVQGDRELMIASLRERASGGARAHRQVIGIAGERVAVTRMLWSGGPADGRFEIEYLGVTEVDESGRLTATILFGTDDERPALREAWARWAVIEPDVAATVALVADLGDAWSARDRARIRTLCAEHLAYDDRRRTGIGRLDGGDAFVSSPDALWQLAPATEVEFGRFWPACARHGGITVARRFGTLPGGGPFESEYLQLFVHAHGRATHLELFELEDLDRALARLADLRPDPLRIPPNAAAEARTRWARAALVEHDWAAVRTMVTDDFRFEDRGKRAPVCGDIETWIASMRFSATLPAPRGEREPIATVGDRISLDHFVLRGGEDDAGFELEHIGLNEVDAEGRLRAVLLFDPEDRAAAFDEAEARFLRGEAAGFGALAPITAFGKAVDRRDWIAFREILSADAVIRDHRRLSLFGSLSRDAWLESLQAMAELAPDVASEPVRTLAWNRHGRVVLVRTYGTNSSGGAFERFDVMVWITDGARALAVDVFDPGDAERALAHFAELCAAAEGQESP